MRSFVLITAAIMLAGCSVLPRSVLKDVDRDVTLDAVQTNPARFIGTKVVWGGIILNSENLEEVTEIEVLETELSFDERPKNGSSRGRFIIQSPGYLDTNIYSKSKKITVAGTVKGVERRKIGKMGYPYPIITPIEIRAFEPLPEYYRDPYSYGPYGGLYGPYGPYPYGPTYPYGPYSPYGPFRQPFFPYPHPFP